MQTKHSILLFDSKPKKKINNTNTFYQLSNELMPIDKIKWLKASCAKRLFLIIKVIIIIHIYELNKLKMLN